MWQKIKKILQSEIAVNSAKLLSANVVVQIIGLLVYPILTRLYSPDDFGLINLFLSISGVLTIIATAEFQYAIVLPKSESKAIACLQIGLLITLVTVAILLASIPFSKQIASIFNAPNLTQWYWAIPIFVFLSALWNLLNYWCIRQKSYDEICKYQLIQSVTNATSKCTFGWLGVLNGGLIISAILAPFISLFYLILKIQKKAQTIFHLAKKQEIVSTFHEYSNFPKYSLPRALLNYVSGNLPILLLTPFFSLSEIGFFGMALLIGFKPVNIISNTLYQVFYQRTTAKIQKQENILSFHLQYLTYSIVIFLPLFLLIFAYSSNIVNFLLGDKWTQTGSYINVMIIWLFASVLTGPISYLPDIFKKQKIGLFFEVALITARSTALLVGIYYCDFTKTIFLYSLSSFVVITLQCLWFYKLIHAYERTIES